MSSRRKTSLVLALGVAALAGTSLAAMVATSELLVESFGRPVSGRGGVVVAVQRRPARQEPVAVREPAVDRPATPKTRPRPEPAERPRRPRHTWPWKRWTGPRPHHDPRVRVPVAPRRHRPRPADPGDDPRGGPPCLGHHHRWDHHRWDQRRHWRDGGRPQEGPGRVAG